MREVFEPEPCVELRDGIRRMAEWTKAQPLLPPTRFDNIEVPKNLPPSWRS
jgi:hypothetical protein